MAFKGPKRCRICGHWARNIYSGPVEHEGHLIVDAGCDVADCDATDWHYHCVASLQDEHSTCTTAGCYPEAEL